MKNRITIFVGMLCWMLAVPSYAHDDGLTCHTHPSNGHQKWIPLLSMSTATHQPMMQSVIHRFDNLIAERPGEHDPADVRRLRGILTEIDQSVFIILQVLERSQRSDGDGRGLLGLARHAYQVFALDRVIPFRNLRAAAGRELPLVLEMATLRRHLLEQGVPDDLVIVLENTAQSC